MDPSTDRDRILMQHNPAAQKVNIGNPQRCGLTPPQTRHPEQQHQRPIPARLNSQTPQLLGTQVDVLRLPRRGSLTPRAGLTASRRSRTASSRIRANTESTLVTIDGLTLSASCVTHA
jgi:hypothetical protein